MFVFVIKKKCDECKKFINPLINKDSIFLTKLSFYNKKTKGLEFFSSPFVIHIYFYKIIYLTSLSIHLKKKTTSLRYNTVDWLHNMVLTYYLPKTVNVKTTCIFINYT